MSVQLEEPRNSVNTSLGHSKRGSPAETVAASLLLVFKSAALGANSVHRRVLAGLNQAPCWQGLVPGKWQDLEIDRGLLAVNLI